MNAAPHGHAGPCYGSQDSCKVPGAGAMGGQQALNSYRNAGAALLHAMQHREIGLSAGPRASGSCGAAIGGAGPAAGAGGGGSCILSTSPGKSSFSGVGLGMEPCPAGWGGMSQPPPLPGSSVGVPPLHWAGAGVTSGASLLPGLFQHGDGDCILAPYEGSGAPLAALGLLAPARSDAPSEVQAPLSCKDVSGIPAFSESMVRNTFIDFKPARSPSVERFFAERKIRSSPTSRQLSRQASSSSLKLGADFEDPFAIATPTDSVFPTPKHTYAPRDQLLPMSLAMQDLHGMPTPEPEVDHLSISGALPVLRLSQFISEGATDDPADTVASAAARLAQELRHGSSLMPRTVLGGKSLDMGSALCSTAATSAPGSALLVGSGVSSTVGSGLIIPGSAEMATLRTDISRGSALHAVGACKPCAFVFQDGCANGMDCEFCHLCDPGERKRRKKERRKLAANWKNRFGQDY